jgi:RNA polymerase sigma-70 factor (ECF subfamily)
MTLSDSTGLAATPARDDAQLLAAVRTGDQGAFAALVDRHHMALVRLATLFASDAAEAERLARETWRAVVQGGDAFDLSGGTRAVLYRTLVELAGDRREAVAARAAAEVAADEPAVAPHRFLPESDSRWPGHWASAPGDWVPERLDSDDTLGSVGTAIAGLPPVQREVIALRDLDRLSSGRVRELLGISPECERALLHRARSKLRGSLESHLSQEAGA